MKKILLFMVMFCVLFSGVVFASGGQGDGEKELTITFVTPLVAHPVWLKAKEGFEQAGKDFGFKATVGRTSGDLT